MIITTSDIQQTLHDVTAGIDADRTFVLCDVNTQRMCLPLVRLADCQTDRLADNAPASEPQDGHSSDSLNSLKVCQSKEDYHIITIPAGDDNKNLDTLALVWQALSEQGATRHSLLLNLGGGVVTDIGGFAAASFKRGIRYINIPTTLLAMVDAATGGKTGINFAGLKNEIGAFHQPEHVVLCAAFLTTLDKANLLSGMAEMMKHILIGYGTDAVARMEALTDTMADFQASGTGQDEVARLVRESVGVKERIVAQDPTEKGIRKALNFGHTLGHAIESLLLEKHTPVLHGYAVAWGMIGELYLSHVLTGLGVNVLRGATRLLNELYGPCPISCNDYDRLYALMLHDKKNTSADAVRFALLAAPGDIRLDCTAQRELIFEALDFIRERG